MGATQVLTLAGELLDKAQDLLKEGLTTTEVADGYMKAATKVRVVDCPFMPPFAKDSMIHGHKSMYTTAASA